MKRYWFYTYGYRKAGDPNWNYSEGVTDQHPVGELIRMRKDYPRDYYYLVFFAEITEEEYQEFDGYVG